MDRKREKEGGRMQCFMKKEDKSLIDVENVETIQAEGAAIPQMSFHLDIFLLFLFRAVEQKSWLRRCTW